MEGRKEGRKDLRINNNKKNASLENDHSMILDTTKSWVSKMSQCHLKQNESKTEFNNKKGKLIWGKQTLESLIIILLKLVEHMKLFIKDDNKKYYLIKDK